MTDLSALDRAATAAPWTNQHSDGSITPGNFWRGTSKTVFGEWLGNEEDDTADAALIVALRNAYADGSLILASSLDERMAAAYESGWRAGKEQTVYRDMIPRERVDALVRAATDYLDIPAVPIVMRRADLRAALAPFVEVVKP